MTEDKAKPMGWFRDWLWRGTYEVEGVPFALEDPASGGDSAPDLIERASAMMAELDRMVDQARQVERARTPGEGEEDLRRIARQMLPVLDALDRILDLGRQKAGDSEELQNWLTAMQGVQSRLVGVLEKMGLTPMSTLGCEVDLGLHDVVATRPSREYPENTIIEERLKGYYFRGRLLRDAKVVVALPSH